MKQRNKLEVLLILNLYYCAIKTIYNLKVEEIKSLMNEYGKTKEPFLFAIDYEMQKGIFCKNPKSQSEILFRTPLGNNSPSTETTKLQNKEITTTPISYDEYKKRFDIIMNGLKRGDSFLANLTVKTPIKIEIGLKDIFLRSNSPYAIYLPEQFVCFSPERFVKISNGVISTNPMKGTINANIENAEQVILSDYKETAEHCTIVDLLRNDIGIVAEKVKVDRFRYIDRIKGSEGDILQVSSEISGKLPQNYLSSLGDIIFSLLPAGSISGAPKQSTINMISQAEPESRGYYSGVFGYFDGKDLDTAVMIRFIEQSDGQFYFRSGGGITANSSPRNEYNEVLEKIYLPFS